MLARAISRRNHEEKFLSRRSIECRHNVDYTNAIYLRSIVLSAPAVRPLHSQDIEIDELSLREAREKGQKFLLGTIRFIETNSLGQGRKQAREGAFFSRRILKRCLINQCLRSRSAIPKYFPPPLRASPLCLCPMPSITMGRKAPKIPSFILSFAFYLSRRPGLARREGDSSIYLKTSEPSSSFPSPCFPISTFSK